MSNQADCIAIKWLTAEECASKLDPIQVALREAIAHINLIQTENLLHRYGAEIDFPYPPFGNTLLLDIIEKVASSPDDKQKHSFTDLIKWLVKQGASLNATNTQGNSAIIIAASYGDCELSVLLYHMGADVNHINMWGESVFTIAAGQNFIPKLLKAIPSSAITPETRATFVQYMDGVHPKYDIT